MGWYMTHAGGKEIHVLPSTRLPRNVPFNEDPLSRQINTRRLLSRDDLETLRGTFPTAIGLQILICGFAVILYGDREVMERSMAEGSPTSVGDLRINYRVLENRPTAGTATPSLTDAPVGYEYSLSRAPNPSN